MIGKKCNVCNGGVVKGILCDICGRLMHTECAGDINYARREIICLTCNGNVVGSGLGYKHHSAFSGKRDLDRLTSCKPLAVIYNELLQVKKDISQLKLEILNNYSQSNSVSHLSSQHSPEREPLATCPATAVNTHFRHQETRMFTAAKHSKEQINHLHDNANLCHRPDPINDSTDANNAMEQYADKTTKMSDPGRGAIQTSYQTISQKIRTSTPEDFPTIAESSKERYCKPKKAVNLVHNCINLPSRNNTRNISNKVIILGDSMITCCKQFKSDTDISIIGYPGIKPAQLINIVTSQKNNADIDTELIILHVGTNIVKRKHKNNVLYRSEMYNLVRACQKRFKNAEIVVNGIIYRQDGIDDYIIDDLNDITKWTCDELDAIYIETNDWIKKDSINIEGLHLNIKGSKIMFSLLNHLSQTYRRPRLYDNLSITSPNNDLISFDSQVVEHLVNSPLANTEKTIEVPVAIPSVKSDSIPEEQVNLTQESFHSSQGEASTHIGDTVHLQEDVFQPVIMVNCLPDLEHQSPEISQAIQLSQLDTTVQHPTEDDQPSAEESKLTDDGSRPQKGDLHQLLLPLNRSTISSSLNSKKDTIKTRSQSEPTDLEKRIIEAFEIFDHALDKSVDVREVGTIVRSLGCCPSESEIQEILVAVEDEETSGSVKLERFLPAIVHIIQENKLQPASPERLLKAFLTLDKENKGFLPKAYLTKAMMEEGEQFTQEEVDEMMAVAVDGETGNIPYEYYINQLMIANTVEDVYALAAMDRLEEVSESQLRFNKYLQ